MKRLDESNLYDAERLVHLLAAEEITSEYLTGALLERIKERDTSLNAWTCVDAEAAMAQARAIDRRGRPGPLHGLPVGIKDVIDTQGLATAYGSPIYRDHVPSQDAASVALVKAAGGIVLGKQVTAEFAHVKPGPTVNPHDATRTPGGSSSGSAAAVAAGMVPLAIGTQTTGSIIRPASYCGVVGYKPTYGLISTAGIKRSAPSFDTIGMLSSTVRGCALLANVLFEEDYALPRGKVDKLRLGFVRTSYWSQLDDQAASIYEDFVAGGMASGCTITPLTLKIDEAGVAEAHKVVASFEIARELSMERVNYRSQFSPELAGGRLALGESISTDDYVAAVRSLEKLRLLADDLLGEVDAVVTPSAAGIAPHGLTSTGNSRFNVLWSALHLPCITVPIGRIAGMPLGVQIVSRRGNDRKLLEIAQKIFDRFNPIR